MELCVFEEFELAAALGSPIENGLRELIDRLKSDYSKGVEFIDNLNQNYEACFADSSIIPSIPGRDVFVSQLDHQFIDLLWQEVKKVYFKEAHLDVDRSFLLNAHGIKEVELLPSVVSARRIVEYFNSDFGSILKAENKVFEKCFKSQIWLKESIGSKAVYIPGEFFSTDYNGRLKVSYLREEKAFIRALTFLIRLTIPDHKIVKREILPMQIDGEKYISNGIFKKHKISNIPGVCSVRYYVNGGIQFYLEPNLSSKVLPLLRLWLDEIEARNKKFS